MTQLGSKGGEYRVSLHDTRGAVLAEIPCSKNLGLTYSRLLSQVSGATLSGGTAADFDLIQNVIPYAHWLAVWRGDDFVWHGLAPYLETDDQTWLLQAKDHATLQWKTRAPFTKRWQDTDPALILGEVWEAMVSWHRASRFTGSSVTVLPTATSYDYELVLDQRMVNQVVDDLVKLGTDYTVFCGKPVVMPALRTDRLVFRTLALKDCDFAERLKVIVDGSRFFNDVRVQGANYAATVTVPSNDLKMQDLVSIDSLSGADNIRRAARQIASRRSTLRRAVQVPSGATLSPNVEIGINQLMPGMVVPIHTQIAGGVREYQRLEAVDVTVDSGQEKVAVTFGQSAVEVTDDDQVGV